MALTVGAYAWPAHARPVAVARGARADGGQLLRDHAEPRGHQGCWSRSPSSCWRSSCSPACVGGRVRLRSGCTPCSAGPAPTASSQAGRSAVLRLRRVRPHRHPGRGGPRPGADHPARDPAGPEHRGRRLRGRRDRPPSVVLGADRPGGSRRPAAPTSSRPGSWHALAPRRCAPAPLAASVGVLLSLLARSRPDDAGHGPRRADLPGRWTPCTRYSDAAPRRARRRAPSSPARACSPTSAARSASPAFGVLVYYAVANASAWTLRAPRPTATRPLAVLGLLGCLVLAFALPAASVIGGLIVVAAGLAGRSLANVRR